MSNSKPKPTKVGSGESRIEFDIPKDPFEVFPYQIVPYDAQITSMVVRYIRIPREVALAEREKANAELEVLQKKQKRHEAAIKANATRKANKKAGGK